MADVTGPISTLPGARRAPPEGQTCDSHPIVLAVARVQGETDSMGCEMHDMCQVCLDGMAAHNASAEEEVNRCDYCKDMKPGLRPRRDYDEGMYGPVYHVCKECTSRVVLRELAEEEEWRKGPGRYNFTYDFYIE